MSEEFPQVLEFLRQRRSVPSRTLGAPGPGEAEIEAMVSLASRVPDHGKIAPWRFMRYTPDYCRRLGETFRARALERNPDLSQDMQAVELSRFTLAPVVVAVVSCPRPHPKVPEWEQVLSAGAAAMTLLIAANASGYDAQWLTEWVAFDEALAPDLGVREGERIAGFVFMGTRTAPKFERDRPALADVYSVMGEL